MLTFANLRIAFVSSSSQYATVTSEALITDILLRLICKMTSLTFLFLSCRFGRAAVAVGRLAVDYKQTLSQEYLDSDR